jgi:hypothetical protein
VWPWRAKKAPPTGQTRAVGPSDTSTLLYGRFAEHLEAALARWNNKLEPAEQLGPEKLEALTEELGQYFEPWFMRGFPPIDKEL